MFLIIWVMKIVLYLEYYYFLYVIKLKIKFSILCFCLSEVRVILELYG